MTNRIYVAPAAGKSPRSPLPDYEPVPAEGYWQTDCPAWRRAERFGDVVISKSAPGESDSSPAKSGKSK